MKLRRAGNLRCFSRAGKRKASFDTKQEAESRMSPNQYAYHCTDCGQWHITTRHTR